MTAIWKQVDGLSVVQRLAGNGFRIVESQEEIATTKIVKSLEDQDILETMLDDQSKPAYREGSIGLDYLLASPFRYPPLKYGSRFGARFEPSLFYAGTSERVTLSEAAYYRFFFYFDNEAGWNNSAITTQHTIFEFNYQIKKGLWLQEAPFDVFRDELTHPINYGDTQQLGNDIRSAGIEGFEYTSARDIDQGINVAFFEPNCFVENKPTNLRHFISEVTNDTVSISGLADFYQFKVEQFLINGDFPWPSS